MNGGGEAFVTPKQCKSFTFTLSYSDGSAVYSASSISWSESGCSGRSCTVKVCGNGCVPTWTKTVKATLAGKTATGKIIVTPYREWKDVSWNEEPGEKECNGYACIYNTTALNKDVCIAYSDPYTENGVTKYKKQWNRCCGSRTTATSPEQPIGEPTTENPPTPEVPYCYTDDDGEYYWTITPENNWKKEPDITKESNCKKAEEEACYTSPSGVYDWGKHAKDDGYTLITSIIDSTLCKAPTENEACYKNDEGYYIWTTTAPEGYTKVAEAKKPADCAPPESYGCYLHGNSFVWGQYDKISGYIFIENIEEEQYCKTPDVDACYKDSKGNYVWGKYGDDTGYTLVPSVTEMSQCKNEIVVPKTGLSLSKVVYIFMAILMAFGVGFIYYSTTAKKNN